MSLYCRGESIWCVVRNGNISSYEFFCPELSELRELVEEAESQRFPESELLQTLIQAVTEADKCATVAAHLATKKVRTR